MSSPNNWVIWEYVSPSDTSGPISDPAFNSFRSIALCEFTQIAGTGQANVPRRLLLGAKRSERYYLVFSSW